MYTASDVAAVESFVDFIEWSILTIPVEVVVAIGKKLDPTTPDVMRSPLINTVVDALPMVIFEQVPSLSILTVLFVWIVLDAFKTVPLNVPVNVPPVFGNAALARSYAFLTAVDVAAKVELVVAVESLSCTMPLVLVLAEGNRAFANAPVVILLASRLGIWFEVKAPVVILAASKLGMLAGANVPVVILAASRLGI